MCFDPITLGVTLSTMASSIGTTLGTVSSLASLGAGAVSAFSSIQQGRAANKAAQVTAAQQETQARETFEQGEAESDLLRQRGASLRGKNKAALAASGVDVTQGDALDLLDDQSTLVEEDAFAIRENARKGATSIAGQAQQTLQTGANAQGAGLGQAFGTILTTAGKVGSRYAKFTSPRTDQTAGAF